MTKVQVAKTLGDHAREQEAYWRSIGTSSHELAEICEAVPEWVEVVEGLARPAQIDSAGASELVVIAGLWLFLALAAVVILVVWTAL